MDKNVVNYILTIEKLLLSMELLMRASNIELLPVEQQDLFAMAVDAIQSAEPLMLTTATLKSLDNRTKH